jgi:site-specific DNA-methyltransferase (adenine-specific)
MKLYRDHFQNFKRYSIPPAQLVIADIPYNVGANAYGSNPSWYKDGNRANGESELAGKQFFNTDKNFNINEFFHFCGNLIKKEPKEKNQAGCMIVFCEFEQQFGLIELAKKYGFPNYINLVFRKNFSAQVLKANMRIVGNCEYAMVFYRDKLPKFNNRGKMVFNCLDWHKDSAPKLHPTQKPQPVLKRLIEIFTDEGDVVIDPVAGSGSTLVAANSIHRKAFGFEIQKDLYEKAKNWIDSEADQPMMFAPEREKYSQYMIQ